MVIKKKDNFDNVKKAKYDDLNKALGIVGEDWIVEAKEILEGTQQTTGGGMIQQFFSKVSRRAKPTGTTRLTLRVGNNANHAAVIHEGWGSKKASPKMPPLGPITAWVLQTTHLDRKITDEVEAKSIAFLIARKMKEEKQFLSPALRRRAEAPEGGAKFFDIPLEKKGKKWLEFIAGKAKLGFKGI